MVATVFGLAAANPTYDPAPLKHEHAGDMFSPTGVPKGKNTTIAGSGFIHQKKLRVWDVEVLMVYS